MTKEAKEHLIFGAGLLVVGIALYYYMRKTSPAVSSAVAQPQAVPSEYAIASPASAGFQSYPSARSAVPGVDIKLGGSPTYLTYNVPQPASDGLTMPEFPPVVNPSGSGCGCGCSSSPFVTPGQHSNSQAAWKLAEKNFNNLYNTGLLQ